MATFGEWFVKLLAKLVLKSSNEMPIICLMVRENHKMVREMSGKSQGILWGLMAGHPVSVMRAMAIFSVLSTDSRLLILPFIPLTLMVAMVISLFFLILFLLFFSRLRVCFFWGSWALLGIIVGVLCGWFQSDVCLRCYLWSRFLGRFLQGWLVVWFRGFLLFFCFMCWSRLPHSD